MKRTNATVVCLLALNAPGVARAEEGWASVSLGGAKPVAGDQARELGGGVAAHVSLRYALGTRVSLQAEGTALALPAGAAPSDPALAPRGASALFGGAAGVQVRPFGTRSGQRITATGLWLDVNAGVADTGGLARPSADTHVGFDFPLTASMAIGPAVGFLYVAQPASDPRPDPASIGLLLVRVTGLGGDLIAPPSPPQRLERDPIALDTDGDGVPDSLDRCPMVPEDRDGFQDDDGCPDPDNDGDGIADAVDRCPDRAEDKDGFEDEDGCPDPDNDHDGIADVSDSCPNEPETKNGFEDEDGCPDEQSMRVAGGEIVLDERIQFDLDRATIKAISKPLLARLAKLILGHPEYELVSVEGHADDIGTERYNQSLSERRAAAVRAELQASGVAGERLAAVGYGESRPRATRRSAAARNENRRVEFRIVRRHDGDGDRRLSAGGK